MKENMLDSRDIISMKHCLLQRCIGHNREHRTSVVGFRCSVLHASEL
jgi:hypothetical protein